MRSHCATIVAGVAAPLVLAASLAIGPIVPAHAAARVGQPAPNFSLTTFAGDRVRRDDLRGQVVLINRWATWCVPCRSEMPAMDAYFRRNRHRGLAAFAISGEESVGKRALAPLSAAMAIPLSNRFVGVGYQPINGAVPTSFVIDRAGTIRYAKAGTFTAETLHAILEPLLAEPAPATPPTRRQPG